jgi:hypothetical protein
MQTQLALQTFAGTASWCGREHMVNGLKRQLCAGADPNLALCHINTKQSRLDRRCFPFALLGAVAAMPLSAAERTDGPKSAMFFER